MTISAIAQSAPVQQGELIPSEHEEKVLLPDLFISFQAEELPLHAKYQEVKKESESWIAEYVVRNEIVDQQANVSDAVYAITTSQATRNMLQQTFHTLQQCGRKMRNLKGFEPSATG